MSRGDTAQAAIVSAPSLPQKAPADWLQKWERNIIGDARNRYCDKETGEEIGWLVSPFLEGFYNGYLVTKDAKWIDMFIDWSHSTRGFVRCLKPITIRLRGADFPL